LFSLRYTHATCTPSISWEEGWFLTTDFTVTVVVKGANGADITKNISPFFLVFKLGS
jgi:hypothetical protein